MAAAVLKFVEKLRLSIVLDPCEADPSRKKRPRGSFVIPVTVMEVEVIEFGLIQSVPVLFAVSNPSTTR